MSQFCEKVFVDVDAMTEIPEFLDNGLLEIEDAHAGLVAALDLVGHLEVVEDGGAHDGVRGGQDD